MCVEGCGCVLKGVGVCGGVVVCIEGCGCVLKGVGVY